MSVVIDLSDFKGFGIELSTSLTNFEMNRVSSTIFEMNSKTTTSNYLTYLIPGPLPVGAKVTLACNTSTVSGELMQLSVDSFSSEDYTTGKTVESAINGNATNELLESRCNMYVKPGNQYVRCVIGFFGNRIGISNIQGPKIIIDGADISTVKPQETAPANFNRSFNIDELTNEWFSTSDGTGSVVKLADKITLSADTASRAYLRYSTGTTIATTDPFAMWNLDGSKGFTVDVKSNVTSGLPAVYVDYRDSLDAVIETLRGYLLNRDGEWAKFWFPPIPDATRASIAVGMFTTNYGVVDILGVKLAQFGAANSWEPNAVQAIMCALRNDTGTWVIDDDGTFSSSFVDSVTENTNDITVNMLATSLLGYKPIVIANVDGLNGKSAKYYCSTRFATQTSFIIEFYDRDTNIIVPIASLDTGVFVDVMGANMR